MSSIKQFLAASALYFSTLGVSAVAAPLGAYVGVLPCADCVGLEYRLDLLPGGDFHLRMVYRDRPGVFYEIGTWSIDEAHKTLELRGSDERPLRLSIDSDERLTLLDSNGQRIDTGLNYSLYRSELLSPLEPQVKLQGMFSHFADASRFVDCQSGRDMPVAMEGAHLRLERAAASARPEPGEGVLMSIEGTIQNRVNMEGPARPMLVVERLVEVHPGETCPEQRKRIEPVTTVPGFAGTHWMLSRLGGKSVVATPTPAYLEFQLEPDARLAGSSGCNRIFGGFERDGDKLSFPPLAGTRMFCEEGMEQEHALHEALAATRSHRLDGRTMVFLDESGAEVAAFEAAGAK